MSDQEQTTGQEAITPPTESTSAGIRGQPLSLAEQTAQPIPLAAVRPDPEQPRHLLPKDLAHALAEGTSPQEILAQLRARAGRDNWARERLRELDALALSIGEDGLLQPIRVIRDGEDRYRIEEGERRWWAHNILVQQGRDEFRFIKGFVVEREVAEAGVLRRRVAENMLRSEFTAIELARAMASRIQEILAAEPGTKRGDGEKRVGNENGMSDRRVRQFVALLTLSPGAQELAQQARLTENSLRSVVGIADADKQLAAIHELMHPRVQGPTAKRNNRPTKPARKSRSQTHNGPARKQRTRASRRPTPAKKHPVRELNRSGAAGELLKLARFFARQEYHLDTIDWKRVVKTDSDREAFERLYRVLQEGLTATAEAIDEASPS